MRLLAKNMWLMMAAVMLSSGMSLDAQDKTKQGVEYLKTVPKQFQIPADTAPSGQARLWYAGFVRPNSNQAIASVAAGERFDMLVVMSRPVSSATPIAIKAFRIDPSGLGSGDIKVLPIVTGDPDERYWDRSPTDESVEFPPGTQWARIHNLRVSADAKQPEDGNATNPFEPVEFPDHVIVFVEQDDKLLVPTLRVTEP